MVDDAQLFSETPSVTRRAVLQETAFGSRIAEDEGEHLATYFVETEEWRRIFSGEVDVVYGSKGAGKSAIYSLLLRRADALRERGVTVLAAENPRGAPVFKDLVADPPTTEPEFRALWAAGEPRHSTGCFRVPAMAQGKRHHAS